ncbi:MAG: hypothetical protein PHF57_12525 [Methanoregula sp.]|jgi:hypothetical protein|nr:hypothetical protein [Methanoregula sp.]MDD5189022.1 hypothetical protein [Methanoregula sp.]
MLLGFIEGYEEHIQHLLTEKEDAFAFARNVGQVGSPVTETCKNLVA